MSEEISSLSTSSYHKGSVARAEQSVQDATLRKFVGQLRCWISSGSCQAASGAFCGWRDAVTGSLSSEYPEITGYVLSFFAAHAHLTSHKIASAQRAADWLVTRLISGNLAARDHWDGNSIYNFDLAMIATGLMSLGKLLGNEQYLETGMTLVKYLQRQITPTGKLSPLARGSANSSNRFTWSTEGKAHLLKVVQCLLLADSLGLAGAEAAAAKMIAFGKRTQMADGHFVTHLTDEEIALHPLLYAAEGLWMWGTARGDAEAIARAQAVLEWIWKHQLSTGGFPRSVFSSGAVKYSTEQSDVTCQAVRLALALQMSTYGLDAAIQRIMQVSYGDENELAVLYQPCSTMLHQNTWSTLFATQAIELAISQDQPISWKNLI